MTLLFAVKTVAQTIPDQIDSILAAPSVSGNSWTILVENDDGSVIYYERNPTTALAPASNTKIFTSSAAFGLLGTNYAFQTRIFLDGTFSSGVLTGNLNLVCEHDPTWNTNVFSGNARAPLDYIAAHLKSLGLTSVKGNVQCFGCCFYNLSSTDASNHDSSNHLGYNASAATAFVAALNAQGISVSRGAVGQTGFNPPGALFYTHYSTNLSYGGQPLRLDVMGVPMLKVSHNVMADALLRHLGWKFGSGDSFSAGAAVVIPWLSSGAGLDTSGIVMNDGSGLSHGNRFSALQTLSLIRYMLAAHPTWDDGLPIGCVDGTLSSRFCGTDGADFVHAKTGSLGISIALSGYIDNRYDNQRYLLSFIGNKTSIGQTATRNAIDAAVVLFGHRGVPISPELTRVVSGTNGTSLQLTWSDEKFIRTGYRIYSSSNGVDFGPPLNVASNVQSYTDSGITPGTKRYYKVSVVGAGGESKASRVYGAQVGGSPRVLIVDGNDRWQFQTADNLLCLNHNFAAIAGQSISGPVFETANHNAVIGGSVILSNYPAVIWLLGEESTAEETFSSTEQELVTAYLDGGGDLFVSGSEIGWDLDRPTDSTGPTTADRDFYHNTLQSQYSADDAKTYAFAPTADGIFINDSASGFDDGTHGIYNVNSPDAIFPKNGSIIALTYSGGSGGVAAVQYDGSQGGGRVMNWGFPFETITNSLARDAYMSDVLRFFGVLDPPQLLQPQISLAGDRVTLNWSGSSGLRYRVQFKTNLTDSIWQDLPGDVTATNTLAIKMDALPAGTMQRFYRVMLVD